MSKQLMQYSITRGAEEIEQGMLMAEGQSVYEMTEDVTSHLEKMYDLVDLEFLDVSDSWTFSGSLRQRPVVLTFSPVGTPADKFAVDEEVN